MVDYGGRKPQGESIRCRVEGWILGWKWELSAAIYETLPNQNPHVCERDSIVGFGVLVNEGT